MVIRIRGEQVTRFGHQLRDLPKELRRELRPTIRQIAGRVQHQVQANASWSSRIPGAVKVRVSFAQRSGGVSVYVDRTMAPHARPLEFGSARNRGSQLRHPVFGDREVWVSQPTRPFFMKAVDQTSDRAVVEIRNAVDRALGRL